jgi:hypothetical protein
MSNHESDGDWDPSRLRLTAGDQAPREPVIPGGRRKSSAAGKFIAGPLDVAWLSRARDLGVTALWVGLALWFIRGLRGSDSFLVSNLMIQDWGVLPDAKNRALRKLEMAGLIAIEHRGKRSPAVTLVVRSSTPDTRRHGVDLRVMGLSTAPNSPDDFGMNGDPRSTFQTISKKRERPPIAISERREHRSQKHERRRNRR